VRVAVLRFPGSNCDQDALYALRDDVQVEAEYVWHEETSLRGFDAVFIPGGFSYGDYLRCGAMASRSRIMEAVVREAHGGMPVIGACNGFQILCEVGLLPGALLRNASERFVCRDVFLRVEGMSSFESKTERASGRRASRRSCGSRSRMARGDMCATSRPLPGLNPRTGSRFVT